MVSYDEVAAAAAAYARARGLARADRRLSTAEEVLRARLGLADALLATGWLPTAETSRDLLRDQAVLDQHRGVLDREDLPDRPSDR